MLEGPSYLFSRELPSSVEEESKWIYNTHRVMELSNKKRQLEDDEEPVVLLKSCKLSDASGEGSSQVNVHNLSISRTQTNDQNHAGNQSDPSSLIIQLGRDISINCLLRCSRSDYGSITALNRSFRDIIRTGELYKLRRLMGVVEHWVYFSCSLLEWEAYDPYSGRWMCLPPMTSNECFMCSDKESLAVGTELLVFGMEIMSPIIYRYSILTHTWSSGMQMNTPRCLFGSASLGAIAIVAGGCDPSGNILSSAELYNSETGTWTTLPNMHKPRKMCSGVFMDGKFYVIGGIGVGNSGHLTCGEEFDLNIGRWREMPNMFPPRDGVAGVNEAPPLVAVANNVLYAADFVQSELKRYDEVQNSWAIIGGMPERATSMNGWGVAFRACGDRLIVIGGPRGLGGGGLEINAWIPNEGAPEWNLLARKRTGNFVYNCAVMGC
ncbi:hypothetical protein L6164_011155 [Bauhinia variegata]|uniref:Uncharacterized protein n=1 Tax=Bauhinia variegata TaxID=167791 RepID=A0ACB9P7L1_BAUVA|nr:hypothetical protein L6164_011155 [Bauhinia variegata]